MVRPVLCVAASVCAVWPVWGQAPDEARATVPDGGMEQVRDGVLTHWHVVGPKPSAAPADAQVRHDGQHSLRLHLATSGRVRVESEPFVLKGRTSYRLHVWTQGPWGVRFRVHLNEIKPDGSSHWRTVWPTEGVAFPPVWEESVIPFITREGVTRGQVRFELSVQKPTEPKTFRVDDVRLEERGEVRFHTSRRSNLCYNPGMEALTKTGTMPLGWGGWFTSSRRLRACTDAGAAHGGRVCLESPLERRGRVIVTGSRFEVRTPAYGRVSVWARGQGTVQVGLARYGPMWFQRQDVVFGPVCKLSAKWQRLVWDVPIDLPRTVAAIPVFDCCGHVWLDDARVALVP